MSISPHSLFTVPIADAQKKKKISKEVGKNNFFKTIQPAVIFLLVFIMLYELIYLFSIAMSKKSRVHVIANVVIRKRLCPKYSDSWLFQSVFTPCESSPLSWVFSIYVLMNARMWHGVVLKLFSFTLADNWQVRKGQNKLARRILHTYLVTKCLLMGGMLGLYKLRINN